MSFYWITRLDALHAMFCVLTAFAGVAFIVFLVLFAVWTSNYGHTDSALYEDERRETKMFKRWAIVTGLILTLSLMGAILIPTTKEMCAVYMVDYLQANEDARKLPDKMIKAASVYFDEMVAGQEYKQAEE